MKWKMSPSISRYREIKQDSTRSRHSLLILHLILYWITFACWQATIPQGTLPSRSIHRLILYWFNFTLWQSATLRGAPPSVCSSLYFTLNQGVHALAEASISLPYDFYLTNVREESCSIAWFLHFELKLHEVNVNFCCYVVPKIKSNKFRASI